jgi:tRNA(Arg) A34 adenosine deaminase TadA
LVSKSHLYTKYDFNSHHVAVLIHRRKVLAVATNQLGSRSRGSGYSDITIHAEKNVIKQVGDIRRIKGATLYVVRLNKLLHTCNSKPCRDCELFLEKCITQYGLRRVFYS